MRERKLNGFCQQAARFSSALLAGLFLIVPPVGAAGWNADFFRWRLVDQSQDQSGDYLTTFRLEGLPKDNAPHSLEVIYQSFPRQGRKYGRTYGAPEFYQKSLEANSTDVTIHSRRVERIELRAKIRRGDRCHYAQTVFTGFGQSGQPPADRRISALPDWPGFRLLINKSSNYFFRAQAGSELTVHVTPPAARLSIFENQVLAEIPAANPKGEYSYIPSHESGLSRRGLGLSAKRDLRFSKKDLHFLAAFDTGQISFYLPVFRAYYGQITLKGGLTVLLSAMTISLLLVWLWNRRFPWR